MSNRRDYMRDYMRRRREAGGEAWERDKKRSRDWYHANKERLAKLERERRYGLSDELYAELLVRQEGKCAICRTPPRKRALSVDHDHQTGVVRGLLCMGCNTGIGLLQDNQRLLERAAAYLKEAVDSG